MVALVTRLVLTLDSVSDRSCATDRSEGVVRRRSCFFSNFLDQFIQGDL